MDSDLFDDLDELGEEEFQEEEELNQNNTQEPDFLESLMVQNNTKTTNIADLTKIFRSFQLAEILDKIKVYMSKERNEFHNCGPAESDPEYNTIVQANNITAELIHEITIITKKIRDLYEPKFAELDKLILNPFDYAKTVKMIGNETDLTKIDLKSFLPSATIMVITVTSTTTDGRSLTDEELGQLNEACDVLFEMDNVKARLLEYVQSRMSFIAPNLTILLGSATAAKIMGLAGGLSALSKIPGCNILVLGSQMNASLGLSRVSTGAHAGFIYECDLVQSCPNHIKRKAARLLSAKCALACRCDLSREFADGEMGKNFREDVEKKIALLIEPPPAKKIKALPLPIEHKKKRGGKR